MNDEKLRTKLNNGDLKAFQQLYIKYYMPLCVYAKRYTKTKEAAEEVVQEVFLRMWEQKGKLNITNSLQTYLYISVKNQCMNHLKHLKVVNRFNDYHAQLLSEAEDYFNISQETGASIFIATELEDEIERAIESLPEKCRKIFLMSRSEGLKHHDIADKLGITFHTVHRQISIALDKLRKALHKHLPII